MPGNVWRVTPRAVRRHLYMPAARRVRRVRAAHSAPALSRVSRHGVTFCCPSEPSRAAPAAP
eukprot:2217844-Prymnesium_polylepis.2